MSFVDALNMMNTHIPSVEDARLAVYQAQPVPAPVDPSNCTFEWQRQYEAIRSATAAAMSGYVSPYEGTGWGGNPLVMNNLEKMFIAAAESKLDPVRMFTSETTQFRQIGADQAKILRLFEAKLKENLTEKGKYGLNEMDIEGLQALTAGKNVMISAVKEQVAIKAKQAELKIKQQQQAATAAGLGGRGGNDGIDSSSPYGFGRGFLDDIFKAPIPSPSDAPISSSIGDEVDLDSASAMLDNLVSADENTKYESMGLTVNVLMDGTDINTARWVATDSSGNIVEAPPGALPDGDPTTLSYSPGETYARESNFVSYPVINSENLK